MARYYYTGSPPRSFKIVFVLAFTNFCVAWLASVFRGFWGQETSDGIFTYPILFKGGHTWYFWPAVGRYIEWSFWGHFVAMAVLGIISYRHRHQLVKHSS